MNSLLQYTRLRVSCNVIQGMDLVYSQISNPVHQRIVASYVFSITRNLGS